MDIGLCVLDEDVRKKLYMFKAPDFKLEKDLRVKVETVYGSKYATVKYCFTNVDLNRECDAIEHEHYKKKEVIQINKLQRKHLDGKHVYSNQAERMKAYYELNKEVINAELKAVRDKRKELGLCTKCGKNKAVKGSNWCEVCRRKKQDRKKHKET